jgi:putative sigma-54 modulation protein
MTDNITVETLHFNADTNLVNYVYDKAEQLNKFYDRIESCHVVLKFDHDQKNKNKVVEINLNVPQKKLYAKDTAETFELATNLAVEELKLQLKKHKEKLAEILNQEIKDTTDI